MRIETEPITGLAHCAQLIAPGERCPGYEQDEVPALRETLYFVYSDGWGGQFSSDPQDAMLAQMTERTITRILYVNEADRPCPSCGSPRELTDQVRPQYDRLSDSKPDELLVRQRRQTEAAMTTATAAERQAVALEALVAQGERAGEVEQLRDVVAQQQAQIDRLLAAATSEPTNGHGKTARKRAEP